MTAADAPTPLSPSRHRLVLWLALALLAALSPGASASAQSTARAVTVSVDGRHPGASVPSDFLGLSFEVEDLSRIAAYGQRGNLVELMRSLGTGVMRFGGLTADRVTAWVGDGLPLPSWAATGFSAPDLVALRTLADETRWRVLLTAGLGHYDPQRAAQEAGAAVTDLGADLAGLELGNEPDRFAIDQLRAPPWGFAQYQFQVDAYRAAIGTGAGLVGPDVSSGASGLSWVAPEASAEHPLLLTAHYYPLGKCAGCVVRQRNLLDAGMHRSETLRLAALAQLSRASGLGLRIDETNNVSGGGQPGVSNTFASALWAVDFLARAAAAGIAGINFHGLIADAGGYAPLAATAPGALDAGLLTAQPEWYALLMARQLIGLRPLPTTVHAGGRNVSAQAFTGPRGQLSVLLVNEQSADMQPLVVRLPRPDRYARASVVRLTAPSLGARSGVELGGSSVTAAGIWRPRSPVPGLSLSAGSPSLSLPSDSAALVTLSSRGA